MAQTKHIAGGEKLDFGFNWSLWLGEDTIASSTWSVSNSSAVTVDASTNDTTSTTVWLVGGTVAEYATVTNRIVTAAGRIAERSFPVSVLSDRYAL